MIDQNNDLKNRRDNYLKLEDEVEEATAGLELLTEDPEDPDMQAEMDESLAQLAQDLEAYRLEQLLNEPYDKKMQFLKFILVRAELSPLIGVLICNACTRVGRNNTDSRSKCSITMQGMLLESIQQL
ncbi:peptide chain release factor 2 [Weissella viridescens]|uniref:Peptide chain release factor 2 n=1 Tax=Weissella viridescens TaxID=1629 RepID=A0A380NYL7_WEIVI|nr:peptide chain release factor 2 [Weissella viridescens]